MKTNTSFLPMLATLAGVALLAGPATAQAATVVVHPADMAGWAFDVTSPDGAGELVVGPDVPPLGAGSARLFTGTHGDQSAELREGSLDGAALSSLTALAYGTYVTSWNGQRAPFLALDLDLDGDGVADDSLLFEPAYQNPTDGNPALPDQGTPVAGEWQSWDALVGGWWSLNGVAGATAGTGVKPLSDYLAVEPDAMIVNAVDGRGGVRLLVGFAAATDVFDGNVDAVTIGVSGTDTTYDFEAAPPDTDGDGVPDDEDACPASDPTATAVVIGTCDSGVPNSFFANGCSVSDLVGQCVANAKNHGRFVSCVAKVTNGLKKAGVLTGNQKGKIQSCAARSKSSTKSKGRGGR
ncbi:MAG: hypothetical protein ACREQ9_11525 [Candidatus Binatia bacterium]